MKKPSRVSYQGEPGANSDIACRDVFPEAESIPCRTFEDAFAALESGQVDLAMIPIENSVAGRVADIHHLIPSAKIHIIGEYFLPIHHQLLVLPGTPIGQIKTAHSHVQALGQCRETLRELGLEGRTEADTAGSAKLISELGEPSKAAIASRLAAEIYGLEILRPDIEDAQHNTTRFIILANEPLPIAKDNGPVITTFIFRVRNVSAALYKALGGFATNGINMTKLESYQLEGQFFASQFYADIEGHPEDSHVAVALEELRFYSSEVRILGTYPANAFRRKIREPDENRLIRPALQPQDPPQA